MGRVQEYNERSRELSALEREGAEVGERRESPRDSSTWLDSPQFSTILVPARRMTRPCDHQLISCRG